MTPAPTPRKPTPWRIRLALAVVSVLIVLVAAEAALRLQRMRGIRADPWWNASLAIYRACDDPVLVYDLNPGAEAFRKDEGVLYKINRDGFRDSEFPSTPPEDSWRIVLVGDSVAWGWGVSMEQAWPRVLEEELARNFASDAPPPVVYNLSVGGYSLEQNIRMLETRGLDLRPDLVILSYVLNDPDHQDGGLIKYFREPPLELTRLARNALWKTTHIPDLMDESIAQNRDYHRYVHYRYADEIAEHFDRLGEIQMRIHVPILVVVSPVLALDDVVRDYAWSDLHATIREHCERNGLAFLDTLPAFQGLSGAQAGLDWWHPTPLGHRRTGQFIARYLMERPAFGRPEAKTDR